VRIALLEDDPHMAQLAKLWLEGADYEVQVFSVGQDLIRTIIRETFDLLIIDWVLPDIPGDEVLKWVRENYDWPIPVLFVTQRDSEEDIVHALEVGADDFMSKPVSQPVLLARVNALLRRSKQSRDKSQELLECSTYVIDFSRHRILHDSVPVELTQKEYELAVFLFNNLGHVVSRGHILESVWGFSPDLNTRTVDTHVSRLRNKLGFSAESGVKLSAIYQHGYRLELLEETVV